MISARFMVLETDPARFEIDTKRLTISYSTEHWVSTMSLHFASRVELFQVLRRCVDTYANMTASLPGQAEEVLAENECNAED